MKPLTLEQAAKKHAELTAIRDNVDAELALGTATGRTWPALAKVGLDRLKAQIDLAGSWLAYAEDGGRMFGERKVAIAAAKASLAAATSAANRGSLDAAEALKLNEAVVVARAALYRTIGSFPTVLGTSLGYPSNEVDYVEAHNVKPGAVALERASSVLTNGGRLPGHAAARNHFAVVIAEAKPSRKMREASFAKAAEAIIGDHMTPELRPGFAVVALDLVARYRAELPSFDQGDYDRDALKKGTPTIAPPSIDEVARAFARWFDHQEARDTQAAELEAKAKAKIKADQEQHRKESADRRAFRASSEMSSAAWKAKQQRAAEPQFTESEHAKSAPAAPKPPPGRTV